MRTPTKKSRAAKLEEDEGSTPEIVVEEPRHDKERLPMIAIVGRPNVGKSTLFNRIAGRRTALVHETPGMTRDRRIEPVEFDNRRFLLVDTGGFDVAVRDPLYENVVEQAKLAIEEADLILFLTAVGEDEHPAERELIDALRRSKKPIVVAVNKCDNPTASHQAQEFYRHGFDAVYPISALHGRGVADMFEAALAKMPKESERVREFVSGGIRVAIVGRQNVGKSSLVNRLVGEERVIASELPGTTRDAIDTTLLTPEGDIFTLVDTAGIRRRGRIQRGIEKIAVLSSMIAIRRADVAVIVIDAVEGLTAQDAHVASYCVDEGCACVLAVNKWDLVEKDHRSADEFTKSMEREWPFLKYAPVVYVSALSGQRVSRILEVAKMAYLNAGRRIPTPRLNDRLHAWISSHPPADVSGRRLKIKYIAQTGVHPPTFSLVVNEPALAHFSYRRHLVNRLREEFNFEGTPIRLVFRARSGRKGREDSSEIEAEKRRVFRPRTKKTGSRH